LRVAAEKAAFVIVTLEIEFFAVRRIVRALVLVHAAVSVDLEATVASAFGDVVGNATALLAIQRLDLGPGAISIELDRV